MNGGEVVVCGRCSEPFEVIREKYPHNIVSCPYCAAVP